MSENLRDLPPRRRTFARPLACVASLGLCLLAAAPALAKVKIAGKFMGGTPPPNLIGGGDIQELFKVGAEAWEKVLQGTDGNWTVTIEYRWGPLLDPSLFGQAAVTAEGGRPLRITAGEIVFNNTPSGIPFADPTPLDHSEYASFTALMQHDAPLNSGRVFSNARTVEVDQAVDLLSTATHEIGHLLGLAYLFPGFEDQCGQPPDLLLACYVTITAPRPFAGMVIGINNGPHIVVDGDPLMAEFAFPGRRLLISGADALLIAQLSAVKKPRLTFVQPTNW